MKYFVTFFLLVLFGMMVKGGMFLLIPPGSGEESVIYDLKPGTGLGKAAHDLESLGIVSNQLEFRILARLLKSSNNIKVGEYELNKGMTPKEVLDVLVSGHSIEFSITFPEGINIYDMANLVGEHLGEKDEFFRLVRDKSYVQKLIGEPRESLEGFLFPETYKISKYMGADKLIRMMVNKFSEEYEKISNNKSEMTRYEVVTLASIIEKETGVPEERPLISSVFHNRLKKNMRLQTDPTVIYGIADRTGVIPKNIRKQDLKFKDRYNTYTFRGLPYGPIANPGREALHAAVNPVNSNYLYFVSRNDGTHVFSENYNQHNKAVKTFQLDRKMRAGKSWRDLRSK